MAITAQDVKALREATGAGMMECKKALTEANGDAKEAAKILREKGLAAVANRAGRATAEGRIFMRTVGNKVVMAELTCETDFVAKNTDFIALGEKVLDVTLAKGYTKVEQEHKDMMLELATKIRENMEVRRIAVIDVPENAVVQTYVHHDFKKGSVVVVKGSTADAVKPFAFDCCLHMVAFAPAFIKKEDVSQDYINEQTEIFKAQMENDEKTAGKPQNVKDNILKGKVTKHLDEVCFMGQMFVTDDKKSVATKLAEVGKEVGATLEFGDIVLFVLGK